LLEQWFILNHHPLAALRSAGVPARLNSQHQAEFWNGDK
jgi:hypothetical protein